MELFFGPLANCDYQSNLQRTHCNFWDYVGITQSSAFKPTTTAATTTATATTTESATNKPSARTILSTIVLRTKLFDWRQPNKLP